MAIVITLTNNKGGVGKTSTLVNTASIFAEMKLRTLAIDLDQQCNCSTAILGDAFDEVGDKNAGQLFDRNSAFSTEDLIVRVSKYLSIIPGRLNDLFLLEQGLEEMNYAIKSDYVPTLQSVLENEDLNKGRADIERVLGDMESDQERDTNWKKILKKRISEISDNYDVILIDLPPSVSRIPINAWVASDVLLVPISDPFALDGTAGLVRRMIDIKRNYNENLRFVFFFNKVIAGKNQNGGYIAKMFQDMMFTLQENLDSSPYLKSISYIMKSNIRRSSDIDSAHRASKPVINLFRKNNAAKDYIAFTKELSSIIF